VSGQAWLGLGLVLVGGVLGAPVVVLLGLASLLVELVRSIWARRGLRNVVYERRLGRDRAVVGDEIPLAVSAWNRKRLPLAWLRADDEVSPGVVVRERQLEAAEGGPALRNAWTLAPFERVTRRFTVVADRRGVFGIGPVTLRAGDLFAGVAGTVEQPGTARYLVRPRAVPVHGLGQPPRWGGIERARRGLFENPAFFAGVREYQPGDPLRRIHARTSARLGRPVTKKFEPAREREVLVAVDLQTISGPAWQPTFDEEAVEELCVATASIARALHADGATFGLAAAAYSGSVRPIAYLAPAEAPGQLERVLDLLARLSSHPSAPFEQLLTGLLRVLRPGATVFVLTARDPTPFLATLRRMTRLGYGVVLLGCGADGADHVARARSVGLRGRVAALDGSWRTADRLTVAG
jgi:uncharacterized protein (DUF58 family)